jgi:DHA1 family bicyclomycin/chloramphenicol resistance-like MFS transporter
VREALRTRSFWCILFAGSIAAIPGIGISGHFANWGLDIARATGISPEIAMGSIKLSIALSVIGMIIGSFIGGPLSDRIGRKPVILAGLVLTVPVFLYAAQISTMSGVVVAPALMGIFGGLAGPVLGAYLGDIFGRSALTSIFGLIVFAIGIIGGTGAVFFGWLHDVSGTYKLAWIASAICTIIALCLYALTRREKKPCLD